MATNSLIHSYFFFHFGKTRDNNYAALKEFFRRFPELQTNDFYIMGQSYGGIYAPMLSARVVDDPHINFKVPIV